LPGPYPFSRASAREALPIEDVLTFSVELVHEVGAYSLSGWAGGFHAILSQLDPDELAEKEMRLVRIAYSQQVLMRLRLGSSTALWDYLIERAVAELNNEHEHEQ
jgi:hypothetical protein